MGNPEVDYLRTKRWYNQYGQLHCENGPAIEYINGDKAWFKNNKLHRIDGPAIEFISGHKQYWINGVRYNSLEEWLMDNALG